MAVAGAPPAVPPVGAPPAVVPPAGAPPAVPQPQPYDLNAAGQAAGASAYADATAAGAAQAVPPPGAAPAPDPGWGNTSVSPSLEDLWKQNGSQYGDPTNSQGLYDQVMGQRNPGQFAGPTETTQAGPGLKDTFNSANAVGTYAGQVGNQYLQPGALEKFAASDLAGNNPYYQRLGQQGRAAIDQASAARGSYGSGGALAALGNYQSGLDAQQYQQEGQLQGAAQQAWQSRLGAGAGLAGQQSNEALNRGTALEGLAGQMFNERNTQNNTAISDRNSLGTLANNTDANKLAALNSQFNQAGATQGAAQTRLNSMLDQMFRENALQSGLVGGFYGQGGGLAGSAASDGINAGANAAQLNGQGQNAFGKMLNDGAKTAISYYKPTPTGQ